MIRWDRAERSSSTTATAALCSSRDDADAALQIPKENAQSTKSRSTLSCQRLRSSLMPSCMTTARRITSASPALLAEPEQVPGRHHRDEDGQGEELAPELPEAQRFGEYPAADGEEVGRRESVADGAPRAFQ